MGYTRVALVVYRTGSTVGESIGTYVSGGLRLRASICSIWLIIGNSWGGGAGDFTVRPLVGMSIWRRFCCRALDLG